MGYEIITSSSAVYGGNNYRYAAIYMVGNAILCLEDFKDSPQHHPYVQTRDVALVSSDFFFYFLAFKSLLLL